MWLCTDPGKLAVSVKQTLQQPTILLYISVLDGQDCKMKHTKHW